MNSDSSNNFQELNALLNWSPEGGLSTMGEVKTFLGEARHLLMLMEEKHSGAMVAMHQITHLVAVDQGPQSGATLNALSLLALIDHMGEAMEHCLSRDIILIETFLDAFAGEDRSGQ